ncbi:hypothetical protein [Methylobacterium haplocladii]|uniref:Uncharacterized protein n=1 Tax=Methylobacterium haplocladii TaxID=1176176 RepID=A0A512IS52_9HYPH|nr:hypothetical protein [Methylobacterium haplocladii]GEP00506.1 hypothetical protein MHA02_28930 [Methylobacterium haplocladii]GJD85421.1 hypothetical protein HPGCJGGD_3310 [Methylobacterium haplocladii]GLS57806.1 hypothetical protein GCM10007887_04620 [Methylobacterium haplocladii]
MSRAPHEPTAKTRGLVEGYAACGTPEADIAVIIGIDPKTLRKYYRDELDTAHIRANAKVAQSLFSHATNPASGMKGVTAAIFWMKTRGRWKETTVVENTGKDGGAIETQQTVLIEFVEPGATNAGEPDAGGE